MGNNVIPMDQSVLDVIEKTAQFLVDKFGSSKLEVSDVTPELTKVAQAYLMSKEHGFTFLKKLQAQNRGLSPAQAKGVLNCMKAEAISPSSDLSLDRLPAAHYFVVMPDGQPIPASYEVEVQKPGPPKNPDGKDWSGWTFVRIDGRKAGSQRPGGTYHGTVEQQEIIRELCFNPRKALEAFYDRKKLAALAELT